jgi:uncharacterized RDD family membrane protein YckC
MRSGRAATLSISTPEGITFAQPLAGPLSRFLAWLIDFGIILAATSVLSNLTRALGGISPDFGRALGILIYFLLSVGYAIAFEWGLRGQTLGKRILRLRVVDAHGLRLQFHQVVIRNLLRAVDQLPLFYCFGGMACLFSPRFQRLGDIAASTVVVKVEHHPDADLTAVLGDKYNSLRAYPALIARLRQRVSPAEAAVALHALLRRQQIDPAPRALLFRDLAGHFRSAADFPPETCDEIADEQLVRNVVEVLFRSRFDAPPGPAGAGPATAASPLRA